LGTPAISANLRGEMRRPVSACRLPKRIVTRPVVVNFAFIGTIVQIINPNNRFVKPFVANFRQIIRLPGECLAGLFFDEQQFRVFLS